jgi:hypothetical protein
VNALSAIADSLSAGYSCAVTCDANGNIAYVEEAQAGSGAGPTGKRRCYCPVECSDEYTECTGEVNGKPLPCTSASSGGDGDKGIDGRGFGLGKGRSPGSCKYQASYTPPVGVFLEGDEDCISNRNPFQPGREADQIDHALDVARKCIEQWLKTHNSTDPYYAYVNCAKGKLLSRSYKDYQDGGCCCYIFQAGNWVGKPGYCCDKLPYPLAITCWQPGNAPSSNGNVSTKTVLCPKAFVKPPSHTDHDFACAMAGMLLHEVGRDCEITTPNQVIADGFADEIQRCCTWCTGSSNLS